MNYAQISEELLLFQNFEENLILQSDHIRKQREARVISEQQQQFRKENAVSHTNFNSVKQSVDSVLNKIIESLNEQLQYVSLNSELKTEHISNAFSFVNFIQQKNEVQIEELKMILGDKTWTVSRILALVQSIILFPLRSSPNEQIQTLITGNKDIFNVLLQYKDIATAFTQRRLLKRTSVQQKKQKEYPFKPNIVVDEARVESKYIKLEKDMIEHNVLNGPIFEWYDRNQACERLKIAKVDRLRESQCQDQIRNNTFKPELSVRIIKDNVVVKGTDKFLQRIKEGQEIRAHETSYHKPTDRLPDAFYRKADSKDNCELL
ncbi:Hypothetical_protein [Hexamita inflata]|uniref:Hypothetical_protein n=1 Tax=Hexamita inflata TaxID=28002 RepID=A0AA86VJF9_9EUKA|nr:Hypothetical protein HINF_LOCUS56088 [Hexamita inflata]